MLYPTSNQPLLIFLLLVGGLVGGLVFDITRVLNLLLGEKKIFKHIFDFFATSLSCFILFLINLNFNLGQIRLYVPIVFLLAFIIERTISRNLWTNLLKRWYSSIVQRRSLSGEGKEGQI